VGFGIPHIVCHLAAVAVAKLRSTAENRIKGGAIMDHETPLERRFVAVEK
jgi:hypothetical protein